MIALRITVHGRVQGVFYRDWTVRNAREMGLVGWVMNRPDGSVAALLQGNETAVRAMIDRMRSGPPAARVERIEEEPVPLEALTGFNRR